MTAGDAGDDAPECGSSHLALLFAYDAPRLTRDANDENNDETTAPSRDTEQVSGKKGADSTPSKSSSPHRYPFLPTQTLDNCKRLWASQKTRNWYQQLFIHSVSDAIIRAARV